jgi:hypothetical protein
MAMQISPSAVWIGFRPRPVARAGGRRRPLIASAAQERSHFLVDSSLQDQPSSQPTQLRQVLALVAEAAGQQLLDLLLQSSTRGDSRYPVHLA